ncbi:MAG: Na/Pi cotransporter family protein [Clostridiaceae bacterium]|nr:Na/Pi cotransporter family protein [Clostridiaceae bacterium]
MSFESIVALLGGLALFIFGMHQMGEGLQKSAGEKMRTVLAMLTGTPLKAIIVGALVTMIVQGSSATTVMVVGFVSAGLMTLPQSIGVIMGANIGTTMTAWIVAANIDEYTYLFVVVGFAMMFFFKKPKIRYIGQIIFAFGLLFVGLNSMGAAMKPLAKSQAFADIMLQIKDVPILGLLLGTVSTLVIQSSSAAIGVLQTLAGIATDSAGTPLISIYQAVPILLGSNIGTTITAILACIGGSRNAKRAAAAHTLFNVVGSIIFMFLLQPFTWLINSLVGTLGHRLVADVNTGIVGMMTPVANSMRESIAVSHTLFNVINTIIWLPLVWLMVKLVTLIVPGEDPIVDKRLAFIDYKVIRSPAVAIGLATQELARMTEIAMQMTKDGRELLLKGHNDELETRISGNESTMDYLENEVVRYLSSIFSSSAVTQEYSARIAGLLHVTNDLERIGDYCCNICENSKEMKAQGLQFSTKALEELDGAFRLIGQMVQDSTAALTTENPKLVNNIMEMEERIDLLEDDLRASHLERLSQGLCDPRATVIFLEILHTMERIADHCKNIADVVKSGSGYSVHTGLTGFN